MTATNPLEAYSAMVTAGLTDLSSALQISLLTLREMPEDYNVFEHVTGELNYELRDLAHHLIHNIPDEGVTTWLEFSSARERAGLERLVATARQFGYRDDDLVPAE